MASPAAHDIIADCADAIICKTADGIVTAWNPAAEILFGYRADEAIGFDLPMAPAGFTGEEAAIRARVAAGERVAPFASVRLAKDGRRVEVSLTVSPLRTRGPEGAAAVAVAGVMLIARDSGAHASGDAHQTKLLEKAQEVTRLGFIEVEFPHGSNQPWRRSWSAETFRLLGLDPRTPPSREAFMSKVYPPDIPVVDAIYAAIFAEKKPADFEFRVRADDGTLRVLQCRAQQSDHPVNGRPASLFTTLQDITARKKGENDLRVQVWRLELLRRINSAISERQDLQSILSAVIGHLESDMPVDFACVCLGDAGPDHLRVAAIGAAGAHHAAAVGLAPGATIAIAANDLTACLHGALVSEADTRRSARPFVRAFAAAGLRAVVAVPLVVESRAIGVVIVSRSALDGFSPAECEFLRQLCDQVALAAQQAELHDALQHAYDDLRQSQQTAMQQERLRALGQMASGIAHDINNAISPVALYTESLLERETALSPRSRRQLETIRRAIEDVTHTVARMREFYRQRETAFELVAVDANTVVAEVVDLTRARWHDMALSRGVTISVVTELSPGLPAIAAIPSEIREALVNLVFNAVDAMPGGGAIAMRTATGEHGAVRIAVQDSGVGMDEDTRRRCLEPFFTTKGDRGTGLGLAMVYGVVRRHGGTISIDSAPGAGTTMTLDLPGFGGAAASTAAAVTMLPRRMRLLLVDDDPILLNSLRDVLEGDGHQVVAAAGGQAGIDACVAAVPAFDAVITDLGMPRVDGRTVARRVKEHAPGTPVILLTGWGQRLLAEGDVPEHVDRVLSKPPNLGALRAALAAFQDRRP